MDIKLYLEIGKIKKVSSYSLTVLKEFMFIWKDMIAEKILWQVISVQMF